MKIVETKDVLRIKRFLLKNRLQPKDTESFHPDVLLADHVKTMPFSLQLSAQIDH